MKINLVLILALALPAPLLAQDHAAHAQHAASVKAPALAGQDAYAAIAEVVRILDADSSTDWSRVDLERLRQHLVMMNEVTLNSIVRQDSVPGGARMDVTGSGRTAEAIRQMLRAHAAELDAMSDLRAEAVEITDGIRLTVTARDAANARAVSRIRGLGFAGLLTLGDHHGPHHLALARGSQPHRH
ncbi:MAG TPA: hypothetical protein VJ803_05690 [Gemmatimonadaceae bacterium]|nr:hypothetical protein [Gemmatimonadaceae bacterium]